LREKLIDELANYLERLIHQNGEGIPQLLHMLQTENIKIDWELIPIAGELLTRPEVYRMGGQLVSQVSQRALARWIQEWVLQDENNSPKLTETPSLYRTVNGRTW
jgi:hypothetical protein